MRYGNLNQQRAILDMNENVRHDRAEPVFQLHALEAYERFGLNLPGRLMAVVEGEHHGWQADEALAFEQLLGRQVQRGFKTVGALGAAGVRKVMRVVRTLARDERLMTGRADTITGAARGDLGNVHEPPAAQPERTF